MKHIKFFESVDLCINSGSIEAPFVAKIKGSKNLNELLYEPWVYNVNPIGLFICPKNLLIEYGNNRIPEGWEVKTI